MRALLLFNPNATTTTTEVRDVIAQAIASHVDLEIEATKKRGHATHLVAGAVHEGVDAVFALGGDGTANEVIQALAGTDVKLGVVPGGGTNVLARALGLPNDPRSAAALMLDELQSGRSRRIGLGMVNERYFAFHAGVGFDAAVVHQIERHPRMKRSLRQMAFVILALREWATGFGRECRVAPPITLSTEAGPARGPYGLVIVANTDPYTYLGPRPMQVTPDARFEHGLDALAIEKVSSLRMFGIIGAAFFGGRHVRMSQTEYWRDVDELVLRSDAPVPLQVDGDYSGDHTEIRFRSVPDAVSVLAPAPGSKPALGHVQRVRTDARTRRFGRFGRSG